MTDKTKHDTYEEAATAIEDAIERLNAALNNFSAKYGMIKAMDTGDQPEGLFSLKLIGPPLQVEYTLYRLDRNTVTDSQSTGNGVGWVFANIASPSSISPIIKWKAVDKSEQL